MMVKVTVDHGELRRDEFSFYFEPLRNELRLSGYERQTRKSKRAKFIAVAAYPSRRPLEVLREYQVPLTAAVITEAHQQLVDRVRAAKVPEPNPNFLETP
jgi:hypothetical protein